MGNKQTNGLDVAIWFGRNAAFVTVLVTILFTIFLYGWRFHIAPNIDERAKRLDTLMTAPIKRQLDKNTVKVKDTYYIVKKMELVQKRTAPAIVVRRAEEEIEIEKLKEED